MTAHVLNVGSHVHIGEISGPPSAEALVQARNLAYAAIRSCERCKKEGLLAAMRIPYDLMDA